MRALPTLLLVGLGAAAAMAGCRTASPGSRVASAEATGATRCKLSGRVYAGNALPCDAVMRAVGLEGSATPGLTCSLRLAFALAGADDHAEATIDGELIADGTFKDCSVQFPYAGRNDARVMVAAVKDGTLALDGLTLTNKTVPEARAVAYTAASSAGSGVAGQTFLSKNQNFSRKLSFSATKARLVRENGLAFEGPYTFDPKTNSVKAKPARHRELAFTLKGRTLEPAAPPPALALKADAGWTELCGQIEELESDEGAGGLWLFTDDGNFRLGFDPKQPQVKAAAKKLAPGAACVRFKGEVDRQRTGRKIPVQSVRAQ